MEQMRRKETIKMTERKRAWWQNIHRKKKRKDRNGSRETTNEIDKEESFPSRKVLK